MRHNVQIEGRAKFARPARVFRGHTRMPCYVFLFAIVIPYGLVVILKITLAFLVIETAASIKAGIYLSTPDKK